MTSPVCAGTHVKVWYLHRFFELAGAPVFLNWLLLISALEPMRKARRWGGLLGCTCLQEDTQQSKVKKAACRPPKKVCAEANHSWSLDSHVCWHITHTYWSTSAESLRPEGH